MFFLGGVKLFSVQGAFLLAVYRKIGKGIGDKVQIRLYKDESERSIDTHPLLKREFNKDETLRKNYEKLSYTRKKEILNHLVSAKKEETLKRRLEKIIMDLKKNKRHFA